MSTFKAIRDEFAAGREIERLPRCPRLSPKDILEITKMVFVESDLRRSDLLFVFGCSQTNGWPLVADLYLKGFGKKIFVSGGICGNGKILSHSIRDNLVRHGVPVEAIVTDERSTNTLEDVVFGKELLTRLGILHQSILFACNGPHSGRCLRTLQKVFWYAELSPCVYEFKPEGRLISAENWWRNEHGRSRVWGEYQRIKLYSSRGDICP